MGKFVMVWDDINKKRKYYEVKNFSFETISGMPFYSKHYRYFEFWEGNPRKIIGDTEILDIFPGECLQQVIYGKKISYKDVKQIVLNDPKYIDIKRQMENNEYLDYRKYCDNLLEEKDDANIISKEEFCKKYDEKHYVFFMPPDLFFQSKRVSGKEVSISIEEYDVNIRLDYSSELSKVLLNSQLGNKYHEENEALFLVFRKYFSLLADNRRYFNSSEHLFRTIPFNFDYVSIVDEKSEEKDKVAFFLDYYAYVCGLKGDALAFLKEYKTFVINENNHDYHL